MLNIQIILVGCSFDQICVARLLVVGLVLIEVRVDNLERGVGYDIRLVCIPRRLLSDGKCSYGPLKRAVCWIVFKSFSVEIFALLCVVTS